MSPVEVDKTNDIEVLITLLKSLLKPGNLARLSCGIGHFVQDVVTLQADIKGLALYKSLLNWYFGWLS